MASLGSLTVKLHVDTTELDDFLARVDSSPLERTEAATWLLAHLSEQEQHEVLFAVQYAERFPDAGHFPGSEHTFRLLIAKLARLLNDYARPMLGYSEAQDANAPGEQANA